MGTTLITLAPENQRPLVHRFPAFVKIVGHLFIPFHMILTLIQEVPCLNCLRRFRWYKQFSVFLLDVSVVDKVVYNLPTTV